MQKLFKSTRKRAAQAAQQHCCEEHTIRLSRDTIRWDKKV